MTWFEFASTISGDTESPSVSVSTSLPDPAGSSLCASCLPYSEILPTFRCHLHQHHTSCSSPLPVENPGDKISVGDLKTEKFFPSTFSILKLLHPPLTDKTLRLVAKVASVASTPEQLQPHSSLSFPTSVLKVIQSSFFPDAYNQSVFNSCPLKQMGLGRTNVFNILR